MANTEVYIVRKKKRLWEYYDCAKRAMSGALLLWYHLEEKYLPFVPSPWNEEEHYSRISRVPRDESIKEVWNLWFDKRLTNSERLVLLSTFDKVYLPFEHIPDMAKAMREVHSEINEATNYGELADVLDKLYVENKDVRIVAFNVTSVNSYEGVLGRCFDKNKFINIWDDYLSVLHTH